MSALHDVACAYRDLWLIVHESAPRPSKDNEIRKLAALRGKLFAQVSKNTDDAAFARIAELEKALEWCVRDLMPDVRSPGVADCLVNAAKVLCHNPECKEKR